MAGVRVKVPSFFMFHINVVSATCLLFYFLMTQQKAQIQATERNLVGSDEQPQIVPGKTVLVSAQLLHRSLNVAQPFEDWIYLAIAELGLVRNIDYIYAKGANTNKVITIQKPLPSDFLITTDTSERIISFTVNNTVNNILMHKTDADIVTEMIERFGSVELIAETIHDITIDHIYYELNTGAINKELVERKISMLDEIRRAFKGTIHI